MFTPTHTITFHSGMSEKVIVRENRTHMAYGFLYGTANIESADGTTRWVSFGIYNATGLDPINETETETETETATEIPAEWVIKSRKRNTTGRLLDDSVYGKTLRTETDARNFVESNKGNRFLQFVACNTRTGAVIWDRPDGYRNGQ